MEDYTDIENQPVAARSLGQWIAAKCQRAVHDRDWIDTRWIEDIQQLEDLDSEGHVHNITKVKTLTAESRISDLLFVVGDKNFSVDPDRSTSPEHREQAEEDSDKLERKITDLLDDSDYESQGRAAIRQATQLGCGLIEGPVRDSKLVKSWQQHTNEQGEPVNILSTTFEKITSVKQRTIWDYFPDLSVAKQEDCGFEFYRNWMTRSDLQQLLLDPGNSFNKQEILEIIKSESYSPLPRHITELRDESLLNDVAESYIIWKCHMTVPVDKIRDICVQEPEREGIYIDESDTDNKFDIEILAYVSDTGRLLKLCLNPLETDERPYSVFCYDRDPTCFLASKGVPRLVRKQQIDVNASWDRIHDNADLSVGPQWVADPNVVEPIPIDGVKSWDMTSNKGWRLKRAGADPSKAFYFFNVPSGIEELSMILKTALSFADVETQLPQIAGGELSSEHSRMSEGSLELLINAANATQRRIVKDWDDFVTIPLIGRLIDDVMQNSPIPGVQGRFTPNAHGTSTLLLKQTQAMNSLNLAQVAGSNPKFAERTNWEAMYNQIIRGFQFDPKVVTYTEEELAKQREANPPQASPEQIEAQANMLEAQNEQAKIKLNAQSEKAKAAIQMKELELKEKTAAADAKIAMLRLDVEREKVKERTGVEVGKMKFKKNHDESMVKLESAVRSNDRAEELMIETKTDTKQN